MLYNLPGKSVRIGRLDVFLLASCFLRRDGRQSGAESFIIAKVEVEVEVAVVAGVLLEEEIIVCCSVLWEMCCCLRGLTGEFDYLLLMMILIHCCRAATAACVGQQALKAMYWGESCG